MKRALLAACLLARAAHADPAAQTKADAMFEKGQAAYQSSQYSIAIDLFKQAYELVRDPVYLFNTAQSYRKLGDCGNAYDYYDKYLTAAPNAENKARVQQWLHDLKPCADQRHKEQDAARRAEELERERQQATTPPPPPPPGPLPPIDAPPPVTEIDHGATLRLAGLVTGSVGVFGLVVGVTYGIKGSNITNELDDRCVKNRCNWDAPDIAALHGSGQRANVLAYVGYIGGGLAALAGAGLYMYGRSRVETIAIAPTSGGAMVGLAFRY